MPIPITPALALALGGSALVAALSEREPTINASVIKKVEKKVPITIKTATVSQDWLDARPLPKQALEAYEDKDNKMRSLGTPHWFRYAKFSKGTLRKIDKVRFYASPAGALYLKSTDELFNLAWMARCPKRWYPKHGYRDQSARIDALKPVLGPKADWKTLTGGIGDILEEVPDMVASAGLIGGAVATGGASAANDPAGIVNQVTETVKDILGAVGGVIKGSKARVKAAEALIVGVGMQYRRELIDANPHIMKNGKASIGARYMKNPKTYGDLRKPGNARPLLLNPRSERF